MAKLELDKYLVLKWSDLDRLAITNRGMVGAIIEKVSKIREAEGRDTDPRYYVCNQDEPYAQQVIDTILAGEDAKEAGNG